MTQSARTCLIVGASGLIGRSLFDGLNRQDDFTVLGTARATDNFIPLDLAESSQINQFQFPENIWPDHVVLCAAMTNTAECEKNPQLSHQINASAPVSFAKRIMSLAGEKRSPVPQFIFLSTSQVFDGETPKMAAQAPHAPPTVYGKHKSEAEHLLKALLEEKLTTVRLTKVILPDVFPLIATWRKKLMAEETIQVFTDRSLAPVCLTDVLKLLTLLLRDKHSGTYQLSACDNVTYLSLAEALARSIHEETGKNVTDQIEAIESRQLESLVYPGPYTSLNTDAALKLNAFECMDESQIIYRLIHAF